jgi:GNAT superfamily N-acetyltransferase
LAEHRYDIRALDEATRDDFFKLHSPANGGGCYCVAWYVSSFEGWEKRTPAQNRLLRENVLHHGGADGYLAYVGEQPVGWCQVQEASRLPGLWKKVSEYVPECAFAISCFFIAKAWRGRRVSEALLAYAIDDLRRKNADVLVAFPRGDRACRNEDELWMGPYRLFEKAGFQRVGGPDDWPALALRLRTS